MSFEGLFKKQVPTLEQLHTLVKFVDRGSLSAAFGSGKSSQGTATQQLSKIDGCLGIRTRKSQGAYKVPSTEAVELASLCRDFFRVLEDFKVCAERKPNMFSIGAGDSLTFYLLLPALKHAKSWQRKVDLHLHNLRSGDIIRQLMDGSLDFALVRRSAIGPEVLSSRRLHTEKVCDLKYAFYAKRSLLSGFTGDFGDQEELLKWSRTNLCLATFWGENSSFTTALQKAKVQWSAKLRCESFPQVKQAVLEGDYCGILPTLAFQNELPTGMHRFGDKILATTKREIVLVWSTASIERRAGGDVALRELRSALRKITRH